MHIPKDLEDEAKISHPLPYDRSLSSLRNNQRINDFRSGSILTYFLGIKIIRIEANLSCGHSFRTRRLDGS